MVHPQQTMQDHQNLVPVARKCMPWSKGKLTAASGSSPDAAGRNVWIVA